MKTLLASMCLTILSSCSYNRGDKTSQSILVVALLDMTDPHIVIPTEELILPRYNFQENPNNEAYFRLSTIEDMRLTPSITFHLPEAQVTERNNRHDDVHHRERLIAQFYDSIKLTLRDLAAKHAVHAPLQYSECFSHIANELRKMKEVNANQNVMAIASDLCENSAIFNCYDAESRQLLETQPQEIVTRFEKTESLPSDLNGFTILILFQPKTREEDQRFRLMERVYRTLLEKRGAKCQVLTATRF